jgi:hypothetical protein
MRWSFVFGLGFGGVVAGSAIAQFPTERVPTSTGVPITPPPGATPALPAGVEPAFPGTGGLLPAGYSAVPPTADSRPLASPPPRDLEIRTAIPPDHEWLIRPEHGAYFISVKSYSRPPRPTDDDKGPSALAMAEALAREIRDLYRVQAFLFEYISEERKAEAAAIAAARVRGQQLAGQWDRHRQEAQLKGMEFLEPDNRLRFRTVKYNDQIAVLVGGFKSDEDARKALDTVRKWPVPKSTVKDHLGRDVPIVDCGTIFKPGPDGRQLLQESTLNPYTTASVVPNPVVHRTVAPGAEKIDPFIVKLNEGNPYSLLQATKTWTLGVKSFTAPVEIVSKDATPSVMRKFGSSKGRDALAAGAEQAESLAKALREMRGPGSPGQPGQPLGLEAFVLHTRTASLVTVGQFDAPNDPELLRVKQLLSKITTRVTEDATGLKPVTNAPSLFGNPGHETFTTAGLPVPIPKP